MQLFLSEIADWTPELSVSSNGSSIMQPHICAIDHKRIVIFQYPQADRASCNSNLVQTPVIYPGLSVSSSGSSIMQPVQLNLIFSGAQSFSILKRIEHHA